MATEDLSSMYSCDLCAKFFQLQSMYACYHGHYLCRKCYKQLYYRGKEKKCPHSTCNGLIVRNTDVNKGEPMERSKLMFPNPSIFSQNFLRPNPSLASLSTLYRPSALSMNAASKKPVHCPHHGCNKTIAVSALDSHFQHDHYHVASIVTKLETRNGLEFCFKNLHGKVKTLCLVLINLLEEKLDAKKERLESCQDDTISRQRSTYSRISSLQAAKPFFIVMAAKVTANDYNGVEDDDEEMQYPDSGFSPIDRILFFITSNISTNYSYTIAISTPDQGIRMKYYGPLLSMNDDYKKLCDEGKGLILNHNHVDGMSDFGTKPVSLDVIIHERGEETYDSDG